MTDLKESNITNFIFPYLPNRVKDFLSYRFLLRADFPTSVQIENTNACNAKCIMCPREKMTRDIGFMDFSLFKKIIDECANKPGLREVHLHGYGECLLEKNFSQKIKYAKEKGIKTTYIVTNGSLLDAGVSEELILAGLDRIKISFYAATQEVYEKIHLNLKFKEVEENILGLFQIRRRLKKKNPAIILQFLPQEENMHERRIFREKWQGYIENNYNDYLAEYRLHNYGSGRNYNNIIEAGGAKRKSCILPFTSMQILWNGKVVPCCFDFNGSFILGDLKKQRVQEVWNSSVFENFRGNHRSRNPQLIPICRECDQIVIKE